jgi:hypothetical protein
LKLFVVKVEPYQRKSAVSICVNLREKRGLGDSVKRRLGDREKKGLGENGILKLFVVYGL